MRAAAAALLCLVLAGCGALEIDKPLFSDRNSDLQVFPLFPDNNRAAPLRPSDAVRTEADAIKLARENCSPGPNDLDDWGASRDGEVWNVWWSHRMSSASAQIRKSDGGFEDCDVHLVPG